MGTSPKVLSSEQPHGKLCQCLTRNSWDGKGPVCPSAPTPAQAGTLRAGCSASRPGGFWRSSRRLHSLWSTCARAPSPACTVALPDGQSTHPDPLTCPLSPWIPPAGLQPRAPSHPSCELLREGEGRMEGATLPALSRGRGTRGLRAEAGQRRRHEPPSYERPGTGSQRHLYA